MAKKVWEEPLLLLTEVARREKTEPGFAFEWWDGLSDGDRYRYGWLSFGTGIMAFDADRLDHLDLVAMRVAQEANNS